MEEEQLSKLQQQEEKEAEKRLAEAKKEEKLKIRTALDNMPSFRQFLQQHYQQQDLADKLEEE